MAEKGYRVFAGLRAGEDSLAGRLARGWASRREGSLLVPMELDVTREDILHEAAGEVTKHLPAGENGNLEFRITLNMSFTIYSYYKITRMR